MNYFKFKSNYLILKVIPGLYVGGLSSAFNKKQLTENKIRAIISICSGTGGHHFPSNFVVLHLNLHDSKDQKIIDQFFHTNNFIHTHRLKNENVLVHCLAGVSRSVSICAAYLMTVTNLNYKRAIYFIKSRRYEAWPNLGFMNQLKEFGDKLLLEEKNVFMNTFLNLKMLIILNYTKKIVNSVIV
ncbi:hypothetical protein Mgra_00005083 [Meloidogyne graminicola]|uniref:Protein-tyrosine-phosphatase n=1 Tax=Meloidogyne graminicola TaxID=189291 RepID=A0A8S9ZQM0_9BILA|nr:hypothetical protein Mgra_00005083 [Meloidogyne graminicola]